MKAAPSAAETGFTKIVAGSVPRSDNVYANPESTVEFPPVEARFVKIRLVRNYEDSGTYRVPRIKVFETKTADCVPLLNRLALARALNDAAGRRRGHAATPPV